MPWNPDGTRKRSSLYKKSSGFKMKSPMKGKVHTHPHPKKSEKGGTHPSTQPGYYEGQDVKVNL